MSLVQVLAGALRVSMSGIRHPLPAACPAGFLAFTAGHVRAGGESTTGSWPPHLSPRPPAHSAGEGASPYSAPSPARPSLMRRTQLRRITPLRREWPIGRKRVSPGWWKLRKWCEGRANGWCEARIDGVCTGRGSQAHHVLPRSHGGKDELTNLLWLCPSCHGHVHGNPAWSYEAGLLRRSAS